MSPLQRACTFLFVPGSRPERFRKALDTGADAVILDLEDAVAPADKVRAREAIGAAWAAFSADERARLVVRINPHGTPWHEAECDWLCGLNGLGAVMWPKAEVPTDLARLAAQVPVLALIETALGLSRARELAATPGVLRLGLGQIDLQADLGMACASDEAELLPARFELVLASRLARMTPPIDGVTMDTRDAQVCRQDAQRSRRLGFGAKLCIHPNQVSWTRQAFAPSPEQTEWAARVVRAVAAARGGVCVVDHKMVDAPVLKLAEQTLWRAGIDPTQLNNQEMTCE